MNHSSSNTVSNKLSKKRRRARFYLLQSLYGWNITGNNIADIANFYIDHKNPDEFDAQYFSKLIHAIPACVAELDDMISSCISAKIVKLDLIETTILRIASYELKYCLDVPYKVILNEALEISKLFAAKDSYKFVNNVLDQLATNLRKTTII